LSYSRQEVLARLNEQIAKKSHLIGVSCGSGLSAKYVSRGGADLILALNSGKFRQAGLSTLAGFLPFTNCNNLVMDYASKELVPLMKHTPVIFGLCATDPTITIPEYLDKIRFKGFSGINNYPTVGMLDGNFRDALEEEDICYDQEVEAIGIAHSKDMFTVAFVFDRNQATQMLAAGADIICAHLGLTSGGILGAKKVLSLEAAVRITNEIFDECDKHNAKVLKMIYGGPVNSAIDIKYMYDNTDAQGYLGGSAFERIPSEEAITAITQDFKSTGTEDNELFSKMLSGISKHYDYVTFVKKYVAEHYMNDISFTNLAQVAHVSRTYLSTLFKKEVGCTFPEYLARFRINQAIEIAKHEDAYWTDIARSVGYADYAYFSKAFKKHVGASPKKFMQAQKKDNR
jgi:predicted TIM-barrel enzyme/AraC-like DNA-binding protein